MQYAKLQAGVEYLLSRNTKWADYAYSSNEHVRLVSKTRYAGAGPRWHRTYIETSDGKFVKVVELRDDGSESDERYVPLLHIRGEWAEAKTRLETNKAERQDAAYKAAKTTEAAERRADGNKARAEELGLTVQPRPIIERYGQFQFRTVGHTYEVTEAELEAFLGRMAARGYDLGASRWEPTPRASAAEGTRDAAGHRRPCSRVECQVDDGE